MASSVSAESRMETPNHPCISTCFSAWKVLYIPLVYVPFICGVNELHMVQPVLEVVVKISVQLPTSW